MKDIELLQAQLIQCTKAMGHSITKLREITARQFVSDVRKDELEAIALDLYAARGDVLDEDSDAAILMKSAYRVEELEAKMNAMENQIMHADAAEGAYVALRDRLAERTAQRDALATRISELENALLATPEDEEETSEVEELRQEVIDLDEENRELLLRADKLREIAHFRERELAEFLLTAQQRIDQAMTAERIGWKRRVSELEVQLKEAQHLHKDVTAEAKLVELETENELLRERLGSQEISSEKDFAEQEAKWHGYYKEDARSMLRATAAVVKHTEEEATQLARIPGLEEEVKRLQAWADEREFLLQKIEGLGQSSS